jgi:hypothetical protein
MLLALSPIRLRLLTFFFVWVIDFLQRGCIQSIVTLAILLYSNPAAASRKQDQTLNDREIQRLIGAHVLIFKTNIESRLHLKFSFTKIRNIAFPFYTMRVKYDSNLITNLFTEIPKKFNATKG